MLEESEIFAGLPLKVGKARLEALALAKVSMVAPFKGQMIGVADALRASIGMVLPPKGQCGESDKARAYWRAPGQWLVVGEVDLAGLAGMALVVDMSDAFGWLRFEGPMDVLVDVLARLLAIDLEVMQAGQVAHTALVDIPVTLMAVAGGFELMVPRSYAGNAVARLEVAMRAVEARHLLG